MMELQTNRVVFRAQGTSLGGFNHIDTVLDLYPPLLFVS
jgi:hypothetical protein